ncbi:uncharacterized protein LOC142354132 [Convolutriloba macropyga]|uniref:uncharacterized protein LOC142354132 n=1 Tax=Convolutriloba macropyga TaxID=536237 RepID=UPI003F51E3B5
MTSSGGGGGGNGGAGGKYQSSWWQTSYNHSFGGPQESYRRDNHPLMPKDDYTTLVQLRDEASQVSKEVWRPEEVNQWGRVKDKHPLPLYQMAISPSCRAVHLTALLLDINLNLLEVRPERDSYQDMRFHEA